jgi:hypothetical protein
MMQMMMMMTMGMGQWAWWAWKLNLLRLLAIRNLLGSFEGEPVALESASVPWRA